MNNIVEVEFKGNRRELYINSQEYPLEIKDFVIVQADKGIDLGQISRMPGNNIDLDEKKESFEILRKASVDELGVLEKNREKEVEARLIARKMVEKHNLDMKVTSVEYQLDAKKVTFYFTADERIDFRELVKDLAKKFKARIELRQIGARDEAKKIGGCGTCGNELCCAMCFFKFEPVSSQYAKDQMLAANVTKLAGICGRLRCCLRYEQDMYEKELKNYPALNSVVKTEKGKARIEKIDIFRKVIHLRYEDEVMVFLPLDEFESLIKH
ncbi:MAG: hypothetical protein GY863_06260 [bacterium]|nr:hypothetical protein [bacterium]